MTIRNLTFRPIFFLIGVIVFLFSGCATDKPQKAGFLSDYSTLRKNPNFDGSYVYVNPKLPLKNYNKFIVTRTEVRLSKKGKKHNPDPKKLAELTKYTQSKIIEELEKSGYDIVTKSGPGTLVLRTAITDVDTATIIANIHPGMIIMGTGLGGASAEMEATDSQSGKVVAAAIEEQEGERGFAGLTKYGNAENVIDRWAKRIAIRMDKEHGKTRK
jgi:hypothetical protein